MKWIGPSRREEESGVVLVIVACAIVVLIGMLAMAIDTSYGFVQNRRAQNASDFAAFAASESLSDSTYCNGTQQPSMADIVSIIQGLIKANDADVGTAWAAEFLNNQNPPVRVAPVFTPANYAAQFPEGVPPPDTCGVSVSVTPKWSSFFAGIFGLHQLGGYATATVGPSKPTGTGIGIVALNQVGPHEVLAGGIGEFNVTGTIFLNTSTTYQPWSGSSASVTGDVPLGTAASGIVITAGSNDTVNINVDGTPRTLTIAAGDYSGSGFLNAVQSATSGTGLQAAYNTDGDLVLSTEEGWTAGSTVQVTAGDALGTLGMSIDPSPVAGNVFNDAIDAKANSSMNVYGTIDTNNGKANGQNMWPLDTCFEPQGANAGSPPSSPVPATTSVQMTCNETGNSLVNVNYDYIDNSFAQESDPLQGQGAPPNPTTSSDVTADDNCPGMTTQSYSTTPTAVSGLTTLLPGVYTNPVDITTAATFADCSGYSGLTANNGQPEAAYPGVYVFEKGLYIDPGANETVTGNNVVIATGAPYAMPGNVPGSVVNGNFTSSGAGNGAPCLPSTTQTDLQSGHGSNMNETVQPPSASPCGGTSDYGVVAYGDSSLSTNGTAGTGTNFSLLIGGGTGSKVQLSGPTTGAFGGDGTNGLVLYQDPGTAANYGFDAEAGDAADIKINGVVYNASLPNYGVGVPLQYWDGPGGGVVFYQGGTLQTGYGTGWSSSSGPAPAESVGQVAINGTVVVDDFNTDGGTNMSIIGGDYSPPDSNGLSLIG